MDELGNERVDSHSVVNLVLRRRVCEICSDVLAEDPCNQKALYRWLSCRQHGLHSELSDSCVPAATQGKERLGPDCYLQRCLRN